MRHRTDTISRFPARELSIHVQVIEGCVRYAGRIDGRMCVPAPTREAAVQALLRRAAEESVH